MLKSFRTMSEVVKIDGQQGEGGGQIFRIALCLSALYKIPIHIEHIRAKRPKPGLSAQHIKCVELMKEMSCAKVNGAYMGSTSLEFSPVMPNVYKLEYVADARTASCISLMAQVALPYALFFPCSEPITLILKGGTNVLMGPQIEYLTEVFKVMLNRFGADFDFAVVKRGYYPKGGGEVHLRIKPIRNLNAVTLTELGHPVGIAGWAYVAGAVHINEAHKMAHDVKDVLTKELKRNNIRVPPINVDVYREDQAMAKQNGSGINIVCNTSGGCVLGGSGLGTRQPEVSPGVTAANDILDPLLAGSCVDNYTQDQMILLMALAKGTSRIKIGAKKLTSHAETAMQIVEQMLGNRGFHFNLSKSETGGDASSTILECEGCGLVNDILAK